MSSSTRRLLAVPAVLLMAAALPGCGTTTIDSKKLEKLLLAAHFNGGTVKSVSCPSGVKAKRGYTFTCQVTLVDGRHGKQGVLITTDKGHVQTTTFKFSK